MLLPFNLRMKSINSILEKVFLPKTKKNNFDVNRFVYDLDHNLFRNKVNLGICAADGGSWLLKDFTKEPNALFVGVMGSGKSVAARYTMLTWLLANSDQTILFIIDTIKGAQDYRYFFDLPQVYPVVGSDEGVHRVLDLVFDEAMARKNLFNSVGVENINAYEEKTGKKMAKCFVLMEEFHAIPFAILNFDKDYKIDGTSANKFHTLMRIGRSFGIWFVACTQRSLSSDVPKEMVANFTQKQIFKVSKGESQYVLGSDVAANLRSDQQGRCYTDFGEVQFPLVDETSIKLLLDKYIKPLTADCAQLTPTMIKDYISGKSTKELYKHKNYATLARNFENVDSDVLVSLMMESFGFKVTDLDKNLDENNVAMIIEKNGQRTAVMIRPESKISAKHIQKLENAIIKHTCTKGIMFTAAAGFANNVYKMAKEKSIELVDKEDLINLALRIENTKNMEELFDIQADELASEEKENGTYNGQKTDDIDDFIEEDPFDKLGVTNNDVQPFTDEGKNIEIENKKIEDLIEDLDVDSIISEGTSQIKEKFLSKEDDLVKEKEDLVDDSFMNGGSVLNLKKLKRPTLAISVKLFPENNPTLLVHCLKNDNNEVFRVLFYILLDNKIKHRYYIDKKVAGEFSYIQKRKLGVENVAEWNNEPFVLNEIDFTQTVKRYLENFSPCENQAYIMCWQKDLDFVKKYLIENSNNLVENPTIYEKYFTDMHMMENGQSRDSFIASLGLKVDKTDLFEDIDLDYQISAYR
jgi:hypothetical protein